MGLSAEFRGFRAVSNVNVAIQRGSIHGIIGPNGAGKTTLFNLLSKFITPTSGSIWLENEDITRKAPEAIAKLGMIRSFQISAVFSRMTVIQNVRLALLVKAGYAGDLWRSSRVLKKFDDRAQELLSFFNLDSVPDVAVEELSYGRRRSLELATTLALDPKILLLDEPTQGMGHEDVEHVVDLIHRLSKGRTIILVEHNMGVVARLCSRITVLQRGTILAEGTYKEIAQNPHVRAAYIGEHEPKGSGCGDQRH